MHRPILLAFAAFLLAVPVAAPAHAQTDPGYRVIELEEQVRRLNGRVEEMNFQLLQFEEQIRRMREEYETRFQELEDAAEGGTDSGSLEPAAEPAVPAETDTARAEGEQRLGKPRTEPQAEPQAAPETEPEIEPGTESETAGTPQLGEPPAPLGNLTFDAAGNLIGADEIRRIARAEVIENAAGRPEPGSDDALAEARTFGGDPASVLAAGRSALEAGDAEGAVRILEAQATAWPDEASAPAAQSLRGQAQFQARRYAAAADTLLDLHDRAPDAPGADRTLFTLGLALAGLDQREVACATYAEVLRRYEGATPELRAEVEAAQGAARC